MLCPRSLYKDWIVQRSTKRLSAICTNNHNEDNMASREAVADEANQRTRSTPKLQF
jgi:hypothetical protein